MDKTQARTLVRETFTGSFDKGRFVRFVKELLNHMTDAPFIHSGTLIKDAYKEYIHSLERIGKYEDPDGIKIDVLIVQLERGSSLERARTMQRNFIAWYLNGSRGGDLKDAALVAFVSPDSADWRFSLVKMEYAIGETPTGKPKAIEVFTPARRYSFLVGEHETSHTAQSRLVPLIEDDATDPTLGKLEDAFNIEKATKEFFGKYRELFNRLVDELDKIKESDKSVAKDFAAKGVDTADFAKKLLGQIVFLYFLQKKGWFGVKRHRPWGEGSKQFLRELFDKKHGGYANFFNDVLEPLFYEALRQERQDDYYSRFDCRIPFLNGGLFDPLNDYDWIETDILLPNELFSNSVVDKKTGDTGDGILDVFDRFNFTVNEDEPLEKEVAVDPEMLGKVFENLLEVKDRKSKGTYYTPREIVHYMCQESLINYLATELEGKVTKDDIETLVRHGESVVEHESRIIKHGKETDRYSHRLPEAIRTHAKQIDKALETIRVCDPAVGSGAFPVGMMTEIIRARGSLSPYLSGSAGVPARGRTPYDFKRHAIQNCLYGVDIDPGAIEIAKLRLWLSLVVDEEERGTIQPLPNLDYKLVCGNSLLDIERNLLNDHLFNEIERLKPHYFEETRTAKKQSLKKQIDDLILQLTDGQRQFDFEIYFSEVYHEKGGFDVAMANPPYVRQEQIKGYKAELKKRFECYTGVADLYVYFYERAVKLLRPGGTITFISSNKYYRAAYGEKLRGFLTRELVLLRLIDFGDAPVFEAIAYASILIGSRREDEPDSEVLAYTWEAEQPFARMPEVILERGQHILENELKTEGWRLESDSVLRLMDKLKTAGVPLGKYVKGRMFRGIVTGLNEAFVVDQSTRDRLIIDDPSSADVLKPFLRGRDVKRWCVDFANQYLIYIPWHFPLNESNPQGASPLAEAKFKELYPAIYRHLLRFKKQLLERNATETGIRYEWYALQRYGSHYWTELAKHKIVWGNLSTQPCFAYDDSGAYVNAPANFLPSEDISLLGILNSNICRFVVAASAAQRAGGFLEYKPMYVKMVPIPGDASASLRKQIAEKVSVILKGSGSETSRKAIETEINSLVYRLYDLSKEEISIVEAHRE